MIPNCISVFWLAEKITRMKSTKGPAAAYTGCFGLFRAHRLQHPISDLTDPSPSCGERLARVPHCWGGGHQAGNGLANTSLQGVIPVTVSPTRLDLSGACLQAAVETEAVKSLSSLHPTRMSPEDVDSIQDM